MSDQPYRVEFSRAASKQFRRLDNSIGRNLVAALENLARDPYASNLDVVAMSGEDSTYRLRVGDYRVVYEICDAELLIRVIRAGSRGQVYKKRA